LFVAATVLHHTQRSFIYARFYRDATNTRGGLLFRGNKHHLLSDRAIEPAIKLFNKLNRLGDESEGYRKWLAKIMPSMKSWTELERGHCAYFAAVALERRISFSRDMLARQMDA